MALFIIISEMPRRYRRRYFGNRDKYSVEQTIINTQPTTEWTAYEAEGDLAASVQTQFSIIAPSDIQGMRKVFDLTHALDI